MYSAVFLIKKLHLIAILAVSASLTGCQQVSTIPDGIPEREVWLVEQAKEYETKIRNGLEDTLLQDASLQFNEVRADAKKTRVSIVYETSEKKIDDIARKQHVGNIYLLQFVSFQLRKAMCPNFKRTNLYENNVKFIVAIKYNKKRNFRIWFTEDSCILYD